MRAMKKRSAAIILIMTLLVSMFSAMAVFADDDDHGADAHSESMSNTEDLEYDGGEISLIEQITDAVTDYLPIVIGAVLGIIVIVIIVKLIKRGRKPKYTGRH